MRTQKQKGLASFYQCSQEVAKIKRSYLCLDGRVPRVEVVVVDVLDRLDLFDQGTKELIGDC